MNKEHTFWLDAENKEIHVSKKTHKHEASKSTKHVGINNKFPASKKTEASHTTSEENSPGRREVKLQLHVSVPSLSKVKKKLRSKKKLLSLSAGCLLVIIASIVLYRTSKQKLTGDSPSIQGAKTSVVSGEKFQPILPKDASNKGIKTKYEGERNTISFVDNWGGASFTISEQKLAADTPLEKIAETAPGVKETIDTGMGKTIIATDAEKQQQTVIFSHQDILVFIRTPKLLDKDEWVLYIANLQAK